MPVSKRILFWVLLIAIVLSPVVMAELVLRQAGLGDPILFYTNTSYRFAPVPNQHKVRRQGAHVSIDSQGLRNASDWSAPADEKILFVGDSVTWAGTYIDDKDTFAEGVCTRLARSTGKRFTCGIAAANQYGTDNMAARLRYKRFHDETVLVVTLIAADTNRGLVDAEGRFFFTKPPPGPFKATWEAVTYLLWRAYAHMRLTGGATRSGDEAEVARRSLQNLLAAIRETERPGRRVLLVLSPARFELAGRESAITRQVREQLAQSGFDFLDLHEKVSAAVAAEIYYDDVHLAVAGHRFYAEQIAQALRRHFPGPPVPSPPAPVVPAKP